ncbi:MAG: hypothetical protein HY318_07255 [Armatimonadetes bacterium]|nr:hypothetical protein [Armatimonadota bacterium]
MTDWLTRLTTRQKDRLCLAVLVCLPALFLYKVVFLGKVLLPADLVLLMSPWKHYAAERFPEFHRAYNPMLDVIQQYYPWRLFAAEWIRQDVLPLWNPYMYSGTSFVANGQSAIYYPLNFLFYLMPVRHAFGGTALLHLLLIGLSSYGLFRLHTGSRVAALAGAIVFTFCGFFVGWMEFTTFLCTAAWLPVTLYLFERGLSNPLSRGNTSSTIAWTGLALGMSLLAGHLQIGLYVWLTFGLYSVYRLLVCGMSRDPRRFLLVTGGACLLGVSIGAPQWLPVMELTRFSTRHGGFSFDEVWAMRFPAQQLLTMLAPNFFGNQVDYNYWGHFNFNEMSGSLGAVAVMLWCPALWLKGPGRHLRFWIMLLLFGFASAMVTPLYWLFVWCIPGFAQLRGPARALLIVDFAGAALTAHGVCALLASRGKLGERFLRGSVLVAAFFVAVLLGSVLVFSPVFLSDQFLGYGIRQILLSLLFLGLPLAVFYGWTRLPERPRKGNESILHRKHLALAAALLLLVMAERFVAGIRFNPQVDAGMTYFDTESTRFLRKDRSLYRVLSVGTSFLNWMPSNAPMAMGLEEVQGSDSLWTKGYAQHLQSLQPGAPRFDWSIHDSKTLDDLNVKYVLSPANLFLDPAPGKLVNEGDMRIYQREHPRPRVSLDNGQEVRTTRRNPNVLTCDLPPNAQLPGNHLHWSDAYYPGWQAWEDGARKPVERDGDILKKVALSGEERRVDFVFQPTSVCFGTFLLCLGAGLVAGLLVWGSFVRPDSEVGR